MADESGRGFEQSVPTRSGPEGSVRRFHSRWGVSRWARLPAAADGRRLL